MKDSIYQIAIAPVIISAIIIYIAYYSVGVVEKHYAADEAREYISSIITDIYDDNSEYENMTQKLCTEYELKARTLSVLISQLPKTLSEDMTSEELRIASGADMIRITDKNGLVIFSTSPGASAEYADDSFREGLSRKNYCSTLISKSDNSCIFEVAVSRRNENGLIIASFVNSSLNEVFNYNGSSYAISRSPAFSNGTTAIINLNENKFIAHTNASLIGTECIIPADRFKNKSGYFSCKYQNVPSFVFYEHYDDSTVIMNMISKEYVYTKRTLVLVWLTVLDFTVILSVVLSARAYRKNH